MAPFREEVSGFQRRTLNRKPRSGFEVERVQGLGVLRPLDVSGYVGVVSNKRAVGPKTMTTSAS